MRVRYVTGLARKIAKELLDNGSAVEILEMHAHALFAEQTAVPEVPRALPAYTQEVSRITQAECSCVPASRLLVLAQTLAPICRINILAPYGVERPAFYEDYGPR